MMAALILGIMPVDAANHKKDVEIANRVAQWQIDNFEASKKTKKPRSNQHWANGALYRGMVTWANEGGYQPCEDFVMQIGRESDWAMGKRMYHADDICVGQAYIMLYQKHKDEAMLKAVKERADWVMANKSDVPVKYTAENGSDRWSWCDALFMAPPVYALLTQVTGDPAYLKFMHEEFYASDMKLFDTAENLYYRDCRFFTREEANGEKVFWGRGNGWCYAALALLLDLVPENDPSYEFYKMRFLRMTKAVLECQDKDGSWHASMLDHGTFDMPENSTSAFMTYGLAWGVNKGLLEGSQYKKAAKKGWKALCSHVDENGKIGYVQPVGGSPKKAGAEKTEVYAVGAFLMAAAEIIKF